MPARPSALARRRARYPSLVKGPHSQDDAAALESLAEEIEGLTISDNGQETTAQSSRLWTSRQQFQETRPLLERVSTASLNTAIVETFQCVSTSNLSPSLAIATSSQLASLSASCSNSSTPPLHTRPPPSSLSGPPDGQRSYATTIEDFPDDNQPRPAARHSPSSRPYVLTQAPPPSIAQPVQRQQHACTPQFGGVDEVPDEAEPQLPRRFPRRTAAQKAIQDDLQTAASIGSDLDDLEKIATLEPTLELYYQLQGRLDEAGKSIGLLKRQDSRVQQSRDYLLARHTHIRETLTTWRGVVCLPDQPRVIDTRHHFQYPIDSCAELAQVCLLLVFICRVVMGISRRDGDFLMGMVTIILSLVCDRVDPASAAFLQLTLKTLPSTMETVSSKFRMDGKVVVRAVCIHCHANYDPTDGPIPYPSTCTNHPTPESQCNASLLDEAGRPLKTCSTYPFEDYVGSLFSDPVIEGHLVRNKIQGSVPSIVRTPHDAKFLRSFLGQDGELFCISPDDEARLTFALFVDFFATEGMKERGPHTSLGIVALACLDLPIEIRYKPEYMCLVCIIPGPDKPTLTQLNHYINPTVTVMLESWRKGIKLSQTTLRGTLGRLVCCAVALVVCDLPVARKTSQLLASTSKIFCSVCDCWDVRDEEGNIIRDWQKLRGHHDCDQWRIRDVDSMRSATEQWRDAETISAQKDIATAHGVRWSPLWRLPYWNPCRQLVVDSMHCLLEGLVKFHCLQALRLKEAAANSIPAHPPAFSWPFSLPSLSDEVSDESQPWSENEVKDVQKIHAALTAEIWDEDDVAVDPEVRSPAQLQQYLIKRTYRPLAFVTADVGVESAPGGQGGKVRKEDMAKALVKWRLNQPKRTCQPDTTVITADAFKAFHATIRDTVTPSWVNSVPHNFGAAAAGTPKAAEWRTVFTIYLPLCLISLFGTPSSYNSRSYAVLDHTMQLVCAVILACTRSTNPDRMRRYQERLQTYIRELPILYPGLKCESIHHMAFHIYDFLDLFGPVHSWWSFPFERLIGRLQRSPTNHRFGELEGTMHQAFLRAANLKRWLSRAANSSNAIQRCKTLFNKIYGEKGDDRHQEELTLADEDSATSREDEATPVNLKVFVTSPNVVLHARFRCKGVVYARASTHLGNSLVLFYPGGDTRSLPIPGSIQYIYTASGKTSFAVHRYHRPTSNTRDPFSQWPEFRAQLWSTRDATETLEDVQIPWIHAHFAQLSMSTDHVVVLDLSEM